MDAPQAILTMLGLLWAVTSFAGTAGCPKISQPDFQVSFDSQCKAETVSTSEWENEGISCSAQFCRNLNHAKTLHLVPDSGFATYFEFGDGSGTHSEYELPTLREVCEKAAEYL